MAEKWMPYRAAKNTAGSLRSSDELSSIARGQEIFPEDHSSRRATLPKLLRAGTDAEWNDDYLPRLAASSPWIDLHDCFYVEPDLQSARETQAQEEHEQAAPNRRFGPLSSYHANSRQSRMISPRSSPTRPSPPRIRAKIPSVLRPGYQAPTQAKRSRSEAHASQRTTTPEGKGRPLDMEELFFQLGIWTYRDWKRPNIQKLNDLLTNWTLGNPIAAEKAERLAQQWNLQLEDPQLYTFAQVRVNREKDLRTRLEARYQTERDICAESGAFGSADHKKMSRQEQETAIAKWSAAKPDVVKGLRKMNRLLRQQKVDDEFYQAPSGFLARWEMQRAAIEVECLPFAAAWMYRQECWCSEEDVQAMYAADRRCWPVSDEQLARVVGLGEIQRRGCS